MKKRLISLHCVFYLFALNLAKAEVQRVTLTNSKVTQFVNADSEWLKDSHVSLELGFIELRTAYIMVKTAVEEHESIVSHAINSFNFIAVI